MTFSITAWNTATGEVGVAVASCYPAVGAVVPHVRAGVGAVSTQAVGDPALADAILDRMAEGASPQRAMAAALAADPEPESRQIAVVGVDGQTAAHTGADAVGYAGHHLGDGYVVAANIAASPALLSAMLIAYETGHDLAFADRMLGCLEAAESAGGDLRGPLAAALLIDGGSQPRLDVRIDVSGAPLSDLVRAAGEVRAYRLPRPTVTGIEALASTAQPMFWHLLRLAEQSGADLEEIGNRMRTVLTTEPALGTTLDRITTEGAALLRVALGRYADSGEQVEALA